MKDIRIAPRLLLAAVAVLALLAGAPSTPGEDRGESEAQDGLVTLTVLIDDQEVSTIKTPFGIPATVQAMHGGPIIGAIPEASDLRGESVRVAVYEVDNSLPHLIRSKTWLEDVSAVRHSRTESPKGARALGASKLSFEIVNVRIDSR